MFSTILVILLIWAALSAVCAYALGRFIHTGAGSPQEETADRSPGVTHAA